MSPTDPVVIKFGATELKFEYIDGLWKAEISRVCEYAVWEDDNMFVAGRRRAAPEPPWGTVGKGVTLRQAMLLCAIDFHNTQWTAKNIRLDVARILKEYLEIDKKVSDKKVP